MKNDNLLNNKIFRVEELIGLNEVVEFIKDQIQDTNFSIYLSGELGAGKTTLASRLIKSLGIDETASSPTFTYVKTYNAGEKTIYHYDLYRINENLDVTDKEQILEQIGYQESINDNSGILLVEWPEKCLDVLSSPNMWIKISNEEIRTISINY